MINPLLGYEFDLIFALPREDMDLNDITDTVFEAGFGDAVVGLGVPGLVGLSLNRIGNDPEVMISNAVRSALLALPVGTKLQEVIPPPARGI